MNFSVLSWRVAIHFSMNYHGNVIYTVTSLVPPTIAQMSDSGRTQHTRSYLTNIVSQILDANFSEKFALEPGLLFWRDFVFVVSQCVSNISNKNNGSI